MKMEELRNIARSRHIKVAHLSRRDLIRSVPSAEGNFDCCATACNGARDQRKCLWREDGFAAAREVALS